jgi:hypothetical protein
VKYALASQLGKLELHALQVPHPFCQPDSCANACSCPPLQPIAITETRTPISISRVDAKLTPGVSCPAGKLGGVAAEGATIELTCATGGIINAVEFASFGDPSTRAAGRFIGGNVAQKCADPNFVPGCIFWEDSTTMTKHFVTSCVTQVRANSEPTIVSVTGWL